MSRLTQCPYCGHTDGIYTKHYGVRYVQYYDFDGEPENYSDLSEETYVQDKKVYCIHCDKYIGMYAKLFPEQF